MRAGLQLTGLGCKASVDLPSPLLRAAQGVYVSCLKGPTYPLIINKLQFTKHLGNCEISRRQAIPRPLHLGYTTDPPHCLCMLCTAVPLAVCFVWPCVVPSSVAILQVHLLPFHIMRSCLPVQSRPFPCPSKQYTIVAAPTRRLRAARPTRLTR